MLRAWSGWTELPLPVATQIFSRRGGGNFLGLMGASSCKHPSVDHTSEHADFRQRSYHFQNFSDQNGYPGGGHPLSLSAAELRPGDLVELWSKSERRWLPGRIGEARATDPMPEPGAVFCIFDDDDATSTNTTIAGAGADRGIHSGGSKGGSRRKWVLAKDVPQVIRPRQRPQNAAMNQKEPHTEIDGVQMPFTDISGIPHTDITAGTGWGVANSFPRPLLSDQHGNATCTVDASCTCANSNVCKFMQLGHPPTLHANMLEFIEPLSSLLLRYSGACGFEIQNSVVFAERSLSVSLPLSLSLSISFSLSLSLSIYLSLCLSLSIYPPLSPSFVSCLASHCGAVAACSPASSASNQLETCRRKPKLRPRNTTMFMVSTMLKGKGIYNSLKKDPSKICHCK